MVSNQRIILARLTLLLIKLRGSNSCLKKMTMLQKHLLIYSWLFNHISFHPIKKMKISSYCPIILLDICKQCRPRASLFADNMI